MTNKPSINELYKLLIYDKERNKMILQDVLANIEDGRTPLVLTKFKDHAEFLYEQLQEKGIHAILLLGGLSAKEQAKRRMALENASSEKKLAIIATGKYIGEGFNFPRLDTLFLRLC